MKRKLVLEVCANGWESALNAQSAGIDCIEVCERIEEGGMTSADVFFWNYQKMTLPVHALNRPRSGNFVYTDEEFSWMKNASNVSKLAGLHGTVFGILNRNKTIDLARCADLLIHSFPLKTTFHRAFDIVKNPFEALEQLIDLGFDRILTSGQADNCLDGAELISKLVKQAAGRIIIIAGGGITEGNISRIVQKTGTSAFHFSAKVMKDKKYISDLNRIRKIKKLAEAAYNKT